MARNFIEIEDNEGNPIKVNNKFRENHKNMDVSYNKVIEIKNTIFNNSKQNFHSTIKTIKINCYLVIYTILCITTKYVFASHISFFFLFTNAYEFFLLEMAPKKNAKKKNNTSSLGDLDLDQLMAEATGQAPPQKDTTQESAPASNNQAVEDEADAFLNSLSGGSNKNKNKNKKKKNAKKEEEPAAPAAEPSGETAEVKPEGEQGEKEAGNKKKKDKKKKESKQSAMGAMIQEERKRKEEEERKRIEEEERKRKEEEERILQRKLRKKEKERVYYRPSSRFLRKKSNDKRQRERI